MQDTRSQLSERQEGKVSGRLASRRDGLTEVHNVPHTGRVAGVGQGKLRFRAVL